MSDQHVGLSRDFSRESVDCCWIEVVQAKSSVMMSQQSGDPFAALIRVNTVVQAVVGNGNRDIRGETRVEYQGRQEGQKAGRYQSKMRETVQSQNIMIKQR